MFVLITKTSRVATASAQLQRCTHAKDVLLCLGVSWQSPPRLQYRLGVATAQELLKINVAQGLQDTVNSQTFMGRCVIEIGRFAKAPNEPIDDWCAALFP